MNDIMRPETEKERHLVQILLAKLRGIPVEAKCKLDLYPQWKITDDTYLKLGERTEYRIKPKEPLKLHNEVWKLIDPKWLYMAQDANGIVHLYAHKPRADHESKQWLMTFVEERGYKKVTDLQIDTNNYDWFDTLIERPENI